MLRTVLAGCCVAIALCAPAAFADDTRDQAMAQGLAEVAPGIFAVPGSAAPMWYTEQAYFTCGQGQWATTQGGEQAWRALGVADLPQGLRSAVDAEAYAGYGLCPGDALPPQVATYLGGPTVVVVAGLPRILRFGPAWRAYPPRPWQGPVRMLAPPGLHAWSHGGMRGYTMPAYRPAPTPWPRYLPRAHGAPVFHAMPPQAYRPMPGYRGGGGHPGGAWGGHGRH